MMHQVNDGRFSDDRKAVAMQLGRKRQQQDCVAYGKNYLVVADGMGGQPDGALAAWNAVTGAVSVLDKMTGVPNRDTLNEVFEAARAQVNKMHERHRYGPYLWNWPATTLVVAVSDHEGGAFVGNIGDSRAYVLTEGELRQVTTDHENWDGSITKGIGFGNDHPDVFNVFGGRLLLATDGLWLELTHEQITEVMASGASDEQVADTLVRQASVAGGRDNISVGVWSL